MQCKINSFKINSHIKLPRVQMVFQVGVFQRAACPAEEPCWPPLSVFLFASHSVNRWWFSADLHIWYTFNWTPAGGETLILHWVCYGRLLKEAGWDVCVIYFTLYIYVSYFVLNLCVQCCARSLIYKIVFLHLVNTFTWWGETRKKKA